MKKSWCGLTRQAVVTLCVSACWMAPIAAVDASTKAPAKQGKAKAKPISRDQLRACMDQQDRIDGLRAKVLQEQASLDQQRAEVARMDAELTRKRNAPPEVAADEATAKALNEAAMKALNDEEARRNEASDAYNARLPRLKERASALEKERQAWVERCAGKDFDELDEFAIKRERAQASKKN